MECQTSNPKDNSENRLLGLLEIRGENTRKATRVGNDGLHSGPPYLERQGRERHQACLLPPPPGAGTDTPANNKAHLLAGTQRAVLKVRGGLDRIPPDKTPPSDSHDPSHLTPSLLDSARYHVITSHGRFHVPANLSPELLSALTGGPKHTCLSSPSLSPAHPPCMLLHTPLLCYPELASSPTSRALHMLFPAGNAVSLPRHPPTLHDSTWKVSSYERPFPQSLLWPHGMSPSRASGQLISRHFSQSTLGGFEPQCVGPARTLHFKSLRSGTKTLLIPAGTVTQRLSAA